MKNTVATFKKMKNEGTKISMLTAYDYSTAKLVDEAGINSILVGDSLGMVMLGYEDTLSVTMEDMIHHTAAVARGAKNALVVGDMPFHELRGIGRTGCYQRRSSNEGGARQRGKARRRCARCRADQGHHQGGIPVCAHIGLTPQSVNAFGGFKVQGKTAEAAQQMVEDALAVQEAGAFAVVLECVPAKLAAIISEKLDIPTIGIGAGAGCDGQVLVYQDMLALFSDFKPKFVKHFGNIGPQMTAAFKAYDEEVKAGTFPSEEHTFKIDEEALEKLY